jgi:hypothetical protein
MFKTAHLIKRNRHFSAGKTVLEHGTTLDRSKRMFRKFTYKDFSLLIGIAVAVIILLTLWLNTSSLDLNTGQNHPRKISTPIKALTEKVILQIQDSLR